MANRKQRREAARKGDGVDENQPPEEGAELIDEGGAVPFPDHEKDSIFKAQMRFQAFVLGYWKVALGVLGLVLVSVLAFGLWEGKLDDERKEAQAKIADIDRKMPAINPMAEAGITDFEDSPEVLADVEAGAGLYETLAANSKGVDAAMAWMRAANAWERAGKPEAAQAALQGAHAASAPGVVGWAAANGYASTLADNGDADGAVAILRALTDNGDGIEAEQALLSLARVYEDAERVSESRQAYGEFSERFPQSKLSAEVAVGLSRLGAGG